LKQKRRGEKKTAPGVGVRDARQLADFFGATRATCRDGNLCTVIQFDGYKYGDDFLFVGDILT
jgi:hypothetical protein